MAEVKSATRVMQILDLLREYPLGLSISEVGRILDLPKSSVHELLHSMVETSYLLQEGKRFRLGVKVFEIGQAALRSSEVIHVARPLMKWAGEELNEVVQLALLDGKEVVYLSKMQFRKDLNIQSRIGARLPAHATALGKAILSTKSDDQVLAKFSDVEFKAYTPNSLTSINGLISNLHSARENSFAFDNEEYTPGVVCFAMPFKNIAGQTLGAISISMPSELKDEINRDRVLNVLEEASSKIAKSLVVSPVKSHHQSAS